MSKVFPPDIIAVNRLTLNIKEGEIFSFLGPNGAGKTTTVRILTTLLHPTGGFAVVNGFNILDPKQQVKLRKSIGILTDRPNLYLRLSAKRNLLFFGKMYGLTHEEVLRRINTLSKQFELDKRLDSAVGSYSKGMTQKLGILRSMIHDPKILFLDEPTAGLDPIAQSEVRESIEKMAEEEERTIFMTTHNLPEAERLADTIGIINQGVLVALGNTTELRSHVSKGQKLLIRCIEDPSTYQRRLDDLDGVLKTNIGIKNQYLELEISKLDEVTPLIVKTLTDHNYKVLEVKPSEKSLEEIYKEIMSRSKDQE